MSSNSCTVRPVTGLKSSSFLEIYHMKTKREPVDEDLMVINLFILISNYTEVLLCHALVVEFSIYRELSLGQNYLRIIFFCIFYENIV